MGEDGDEERKGNGAAAASSALPSCSRCGEPAKLQCPKCLEFGLPKASSCFCSQDCFKAAWPEHKASHKPNPSSDWSYVTNRGAGRSFLPPSNFPWTGKLRPFKVGPTRSVPASIPLPDYAKTGIPTSELESKQQHFVPVRGEKEIARARRACRAGREILDEAAKIATRPGTTTDEIDRIVHDATVERGAYPSPLNYFNFPKSVCTSVNEVVCHGIPDQRELEEGDVVNVDVTAFVDGYHGDLNETFAVGKVSERDRALIKCSHDCLMEAIKLVRPGARYRDLGDAVSRRARADGFSVVRTYCGHGIGDLFHCAPSIPHYAANKAVGMMKKGHVFTIEPMINAGGWRDVTWPDGWTAATADGDKSAQFEHTMVVTENGCEVLTARLESSPPLCFE